MYLIPQFQIEKDVPLPMGAVFGKKNQRWPLMEMNIGDSFLVPREIESFSEIKRILHVAASTTGRRMKRKYSVYQTPEGARCWRIK